MDKIKIQQISEAVDKGGLSFPEVVKGLLAAGVEYYHVDYAARRKTFYDGAGTVIEKPLQLEDAPPVAPEFQLEALRANIRDSQQRGQPFPDFSRRAMAAGAQGYFAFLRGQRVLYLGRQGDHHTEWFPGAAPSRPPG